MRSGRVRGHKRRYAMLILGMAPLLIGADDGFASRLLSRHNEERARRAIPPLSWNPALARSASVWAEHLAATGTFHHAPENETAPEGENLWAGTPHRFTPEAMVDAWAREQRVFRPGRFPDNSTTGRVADVGHYTQLMWRATHSVGCALAHGAREDVLVCRYSEAGNYEGEIPF
ncbi:CAP domain-containing protein [Sphingomonas sp. XXL09]|uniref:CAP domain-containing protein n=1 Tax=Sphingomonas sp. XXL09 TaxID=3457787 RepID=UPI00406BCEB8